MSASAGLKGELIDPPSKCRYMTLIKLNSIVDVSICIAARGNESGLSSPSQRAGAHMSTGSARIAFDSCFTGLEL